MQRRIADRRGIGVGAAFQQQRRHAGVPAVRRDHQRAGTVRRGIVRVGPRGEQQPCRRRVARSRREQQRRAAAARDGVVQLLAAGALRDLAGHGLGIGARARPHVGAPGQQRPHGIGMASRGGPHQRRLLMRRLAGVRAGAGLEQRLHASRLAGAGAGHQGGFAARQRRVRIGSRTEQARNHRAAAIGAREEERRGPGVIGRAGPRAGGQQQVDGWCVVEVHGPMQRRRAVALRWLTSAPWRTRARTRARSCARTASISGTSPGAASVEAPSKSAAPTQAAAQRKSCLCIEHLACSACCLCLLPSAFCLQLNPDSTLSSSRPVLSPMRSSRTPSVSSSVRWRLASGVSLGYRMCRPPFRWPDAPPARSSGM